MAMVITIMIVADADMRAGADSADVDPNPDASGRSGSKRNWDGAPDREAKRQQHFP
jgi:hypothetical protein